MATFWIAHLCVLGCKDNRHCTSYFNLAFSRGLHVPGSPAQAQGLQPLGNEVVPRGTGRIVWYLGTGYLVHSQATTYSNIFTQSRITRDPKTNRAEWHRRRYDQIAGIVNDSGDIRGCYHDVFDGITVSDKLRELLVNSDSENADTFSLDEQQELLFHVFRALCVGGGVCQPDDRLDAYTRATKTLYKVRR